MHHLYFSGAPAEHMALGAVLLGGRGDPADLPHGRGLELPPARRRARSRSRATPFPHRWAVMFLVAVGFWNFLGAGIFGFLINLPVVCYYEIGTALTANHGHAAMMGVYGMLAVGARALLPALPDPARALDRARGEDELLGAQHRARLDVHSRRSSRSASGSSMSRSTTATSHARSLDYLSTQHEHRARVAAAARRRRSSSSVGVLPVLYLTYIGVRHTVKRVVIEEPEEILFTEVTEPKQPAGARMSGVATDSLLAAGYGLFLVLVALGLDALARHSHRRSELYRTAGFSLPRAARRLGVPGGREASVGSRPMCSCGWSATEPAPTSATRARARTTAPIPTPAARSRGLLDPWPHSEVGRFHRGIAVAIVCFGMLVIGAGRIAAP